MFKIRFTSSFEWLGLAILVLTHWIAAYSSFGFHHPDEHFQILEFANYWVGLSGSQNLPWEFGAQIRPWLQPMMHGLLMKLAILLHAYNPFSLAFIFRILYSAFNIGAILLLWQGFREKWTINPRWFLAICLLWFFPYLHVRTSSENLSGILITFAFALSFRTGKELAMGILFGFAFVTRCQVALGLFGYGLSILYRDRKLTRETVRLLLGFLIPVIIGTVLDRVGYGNWVFTPYRYFKVNLVDGVAATFNPYPWYQYFIWIVQLNPFVSLPLLAGVFAFARKTRFGPLSCFVLSYFVLHLLITNKEYRFLFPVMNLVPFMAAASFASFNAVLFRPVFWILYSAINATAFAVSTLHGASVETLWAVHMANRYAEPNETWLSNRDYLDQFSRGYYHLTDHQLKLMHNRSELASALDAEPTSKVLIDGKLEDASTSGMLDELGMRHCEILTSARPEFIFHLEKWFPGVKRLAYKAVFQCKNN